MNVTDEMVEAAARAIYEIDPYYETEEYIDGFPVSPGGNLTWKQVKDRDAEFTNVRGFMPITQFAYRAARAALEAAAEFE